MKEIEMVALPLSTLNKVLNILVQLPYKQSAELINEINTDTKQLNVSEDAGDSDTKKPAPTDTGAVAN